MSDERCPTVLLFGSPGAGKGTQGAILTRIPGFVHSSSGEIFRSLDKNSAIAKEIASFTKRGELAPDDLTIRVWKEWLDEQITQQKYNPDEDLLILDGIPRNVHQCSMIRPHVDVRHVIYLENSDQQTMINRILRRARIEGRSDDIDEAIIRRRFAIYREETEPVLKYYPPEIVSEIDPLGTAAEVLRRILDCLIPVQNEFLRDKRCQKQSN